MISVLKSKLLSFVCVFLSVLLIVFSANVITVHLHNRIDNTQNQILKRIFSVDTLQANAALTMGEKTIDVAGKYLYAIIDRTVETQEIQKINTDVLIAIYLSIPKNVSISHFNLEEKTVKITYTAKSEADHLEMIENLREHEVFSEIEIFSVDATQEDVSVVLNLYF